MNIAICVFIVLLALQNMALFGIANHLRNIMLTLDEIHEDRPRQKMRRTLMDKIGGARTEDSFR